MEDPVIDRFMGSGLRAAAWLGPSCSKFYTSCGQDEIEIVSATAPHPTLVAEERAEPTSFLYETPVSSPRLVCGHPNHEPRTIREQSTLVFGTVEEQPRVTADIAVVDPQHSLSLTDISERIEANRLAIVSNRREALQITGSSDVLEAGRRLRDMTKAEAVIIKCGALGAVVIAGDGWNPVSVHPTDRVHPVGSGDVFSASFARDWITGSSPVEAAAKASASTAGYCGTGQLGPVPLPIPAIDDVPPPSEYSIATPPRVYLASSYVTLPQRWLMRQAQRALEDIGVRVFNPLRDVGPVIDPAETALLDSDAIAECDALLLLMDGAGSGVSWEAGAAQTQGIPVVAYKSSVGPNDLTMIRGHSGTVFSDFSTAVYHAAWQACRRTE